MRVWRFGENGEIWAPREKKKVASPAFQSSQCRLKVFEEMFLDVLRGGDAGEASRLLLGDGLASLASSTGSSGDSDARGSVAASGAGANEAGGDTFHAAADVRVVRALNEGTASSAGVIGGSQGRTSSAGSGTVDNNVYLEGGRDIGDSEQSYERDDESRTSHLHQHLTSMPLTQEGTETVRNVLLTTTTDCHVGNSW